MKKIIPDAALDAITSRYDGGELPSSIGRDYGCGGNAIGTFLTRRGVKLRPNRLDIDLRGRRFGRLVARRAVPAPGGRTKWVCRCDCGQTSTVQQNNLLSDAGHHTRSCGCLRKEVSVEMGKRTVKHGHRRKGVTAHELYAIWHSMNGRCSSPGNKAYRHYGGRGIRVCERWRHSFPNFLADMGERPKGTTLERINVNGHYEPTNCRWATWSEQSINKRPSAPWVRAGYVLAMAVLQSPIWETADDELRAAVEKMLPPSSTPQGAAK